MNVRLKKDLGCDGVKKGVVGLLFPVKRKSVKLKDLSDRKISELIGLLGERVEEFLDIEAYNARLYVPRHFVPQLPPGAIATYELEDHKSVCTKEDNLSREEKSMLADLASEMEN